MRNHAFKLQGTHIDHDEVTCGAQDLYFKGRGQTLEIKGRNKKCLIGIHCLAHISTMHHRIPKLLSTHVHHYKIACEMKTQVCTWKVKVTHFKDEHFDN